MTDVFMANDTIKALYGLDPDPERTFEDQFSKVSLESILFHVVATCIWTLEKMFDRHKQEVDDLISELKPHSLLWYANKAKAYQDGCSLLPDSDQYDNTNLSDGEVRKKQVVKYAAVVERAAIVYLKVAGGSEGNRHPLSEAEEAGLKEYFMRVKDAGVKLEIVNEAPNEFDIDIDIYYNPQVFDKDLVYKNTNKKLVHDTIASFVENLPFNGEYRNSSLIAALLELDGVELVELKEVRRDGKPFEARWTPENGYFSVNKDMLGINAIAYETVSD